MLYISGVNIYGGPIAHKALGFPKAVSFHHEYSSMACTVEFVNDVQSAIDHIHRYGRYLIVVTPVSPLSHSTSCFLKQKMRFNVTQISIFYLFQCSYRLYRHYR